MSEMIRTDSRGRVTLAGHPDSAYLLREEPGGVLVLEPAVVMSAAQASYLRNGQGIPPCPRTPASRRRCLAASTTPLS
ncbi:hypothetical protein PICSAR14_01031 [Mycobacterium avium subsp. paratuberculosis]|nr:hypothetical protein PICSAR14_01031 [Mycobacterium avium subsp. paratuberculosis]